MVRDTQKTMEAWFAAAFALRLVSDWPPDDIKKSATGRAEKEEG
jgi:hypothetical protein